MGLVRAEKSAAVPLAAKPVSDRIKGKGGGKGLKSYNVLFCTVHYEIFCFYFFRERE